MQKKQPSQVLLELDPSGSLGLGLGRGRGRGGRPIAASGRGSLGRVERTTSKSYSTNTQPSWVPGVERLCRPASCNSTGSASEHVYFPSILYFPFLFFDPFFRTGLASPVVVRRAPSSRRTEVPAVEFPSCSATRSGYLALTLADTLTTARGPRGGVCEVPRMTMSMG